jgi:hypothetical protein
MFRYAAAVFILKNIGVTATPEQIQSKLNALVKFNVTGNEAGAMW